MGTTLYNLMHGTNPLSQSLLRALELERASVKGWCRFRDCYVQRTGEGGFEIHLLTRAGGLNRADYVAPIALLQQHPLYLRDFELASDKTYATFVYRVPESALAEIEEAVRRDPKIVPDPFAERMDAFLNRMKNEPNHPEVLRVHKVMEPTIRKVQAAMDRGARGVGIVDDDGGTSVPGVFVLGDP